MEGKKFVRELLMEGEKRETGGFPAMFSTKLSKPVAVGKKDAYKEAGDRIRPFVNDLVDKREKKEKKSDKGHSELR